MEPLTSGRWVVTISSQPLYPAEQVAQCDAVKGDNKPHSGHYGGTRWRSWLRHCATSRKIAGSIPDGINGIFHWHNPSGRSTQPLTEMSTRNTSWGQRRPVRRPDNLTTFMCRLSWNLGASTSWNSLGLSTPVMGLFLLWSLHKLRYPGSFRSSILMWLTYLTASNLYTWNT